MLPGSNTSCRRRRIKLLHLNKCHDNQRRSFRRASPSAAANASRHLHPGSNRPSAAEDAACLSVHERALSLSWKTRAHVNRFKHGVHRKPGESRATEKVREEKPVAANSRRLHNLSTADYRTQRLFRPEQQLQRRVTLSLLLPHFVIIRNQS